MWLPTNDGERSGRDTDSHLIDEVVSSVYQAEDFAFYSTNSKTLFMFLGVGPVNPLHNSEFNFELDVLEKGVKTYIAIATTR